MQTSPVNKIKRSYRLRWARHHKRWFGKWHLYLGIIAGAIVAFVGITGSILVFQDEIDAALNPELFKVMKQEHRMTFDEIIPVVQQKYPSLKFSYLMKDESDELNHAYHFFNFKTKEEFFIDPYTGNLTGKRLRESSFIRIVLQLHTSLLVPVAGRYIVGIASLCLLILTISGLRLWIPQKWRQLKAALTIKFTSGFKRQNYDWHNVLGFYSSPVVALLALTGFCISFSPLVIALLFVLSGRSPKNVQQLLGAKSTYTKGVQPLPLKQILAAGRHAMPDAIIGGMALPADSSGSYRLDVLRKGLPAGGKREMLIIDQYTGKVLLNSYTGFPVSGSAYLGWLTPIHYGTFGGLPTRILALGGSLMPLVLFITGFIIWWPRHRKRKRNEARKAAGNYTPPVRVAPVSATQLIPVISGPRYFFNQLKQGFRYALWFVLISAVMGALYGLFSGIIIQPAAFAVSFTCLLVVFNFAVSLPLFMIKLIFLAPFKKAGTGVIRYFAWSFSFLIVYLICYFCIMNTGIRIF